MILSYFSSQGLWNGAEVGYEALESQKHREKLCKHSSQHTKGLTRCQSTHQPKGSRGQGPGHQQLPLPQS